MFTEYITSFSVRQKLMKGLSSRTIPAITVILLTVFDLQLTHPLTTVMARCTDDVPSLYFLHIPSVVS